MWTKSSGLFGSRGCRERGGKSLNRPGKASPVGVAATLSEAFCCELRPSLRSLPDTGGQPQRRMKDARSHSTTAHQFWQGRSKLVLRVKVCGVKHPHSKNQIQKGTLPKTFGCDYAQASLVGTFSIPGDRARTGSLFYVKSALSGRRPFAKFARRLFRKPSVSCAKAFL